LQPGSDEVTQVDLSLPAKLTMPGVVKSDRPAQLGAADPGLTPQQYGSLPPGAPRPSVRPGFSRPPPEPPKKQLKAVWMVAVLFLVLGTTVTLAILRSAKISEEEELARQRAAAAAASAAAAAAPPPAAPKPLLRVSQLWTQAATRAKAWHRDAMLVQMQAGPLDAHGVLASGKGSARFEYAIPANTTSIPPRSKSERFVVTIDDSGTHIEETKGAGGVAEASDPACPSEEALRIGPAAAAEDASLQLSYAFDPRLEKSAWLVSDAANPQTQRALDGQSCAVIVR
jgi:hypothetical protein